MTEKQKKVTAALGGVMLYLKQEKEQQGLPVETVRINSPMPWQLYGRQLIMQNRDLMQRRVIKR